MLIPTNAFVRYSKTERFERAWLQDERTPPDDTRRAPVEDPPEPKDGPNAPVREPGPEPKKKYADGGPRTA